MSRGKVTTAMCKELIAASVRADDDIWAALREAADGFGKRADAENPACWKRVSKRKLQGEWVRDFSFTGSELEDEVLARVYSGPDDAEVGHAEVGFVWRPADFYFVIEDYGEEAGGVIATVTRRDIFDRDGCVSDQSEADRVVPEGFYRLSESAYEFEMPREQAHAALVEAGFVFKPDLLARFGGGA